MTARSTARRLRGPLASALLGLGALTAITGPTLAPPEPALVPVASGTPSPPTWLPFRQEMKIGCVRTNCPGPYHGYWAIDFETITNAGGAPVYAAGAGTVRIISRGTACGGAGTAANAVAVNHGNGVESVYVHLKDISVAAGAYVTPNTVIGHVGSTGHTIPCPDNHLHFEVRRNGASVNPGYLRACHGPRIVNYPQVVGFSDWNAIPAQAYAGGPLTAEGRTAYSTGTLCASASPIGQVVHVTPSLGSVHVDGWSLDPNTAAANQVRVYVDGAAKLTVTANGYWPGVATRYPGYGADHGFSQRVFVPPGNRRVCVNGLNYPNTAGTHQSLLCTTTSISGSPGGRWETLAEVSAGWRVTGWALDPETTAVMHVRVYIDGVHKATLRTDDYRADVARNYAPYGPYHGFDNIIVLPAGPRRVCLIAMNLGGLGTNTSLGCRSVTA